MVGMNQIAAAAYGASQKLGNSPGRLADTKASFSDMLAEGLNSAVESQHEAEGASLDMVSGKADINDVILATQEADMMLNTVVAIRDKIIQAYQDVLRMAI
jgi:flagellar hook-basal body complex protein FliE